ncbi:MAG: cellulase family glycosylhydrolase [Nibricoccus sp.]
MSLFLRFLVLISLAFPLVQNSASAAGTFTFKRGVNISHWLSQNYAERPYAANWFTEEDVAWIAQQGFDHVRLPVDGRLWRNADGSLDETKIAPFVRALRWTREHGLGAILDMHFLPGANFDSANQESAVFTDLKLQADVAAFWEKVATRFKAEGDNLRFEIINEPVAKENAQLNPFNTRMLAAIRASNPTRIVYLTSNRWSGFSTINDVVLPDDPHIALTLHFYEPFVFTHQRANWVQLPPDMPAVKFPGHVPDLSKSTVPADHFVQASSNTELTVAQIDQAFAIVAAWADKNLKGRELYIGEFGAYDTADADSRRNYMKAVAAACNRHHWSWAVWDYQGGFAVRSPEGKPTAILEGLPLR